MKRFPDRKARSFVTVMIVIALSSLLLRVAIEKIIEISIKQNESYAQATLKLVSAAMENYSRDHQGDYPLSITALTEGSPLYMDKDYLADSPVKGYEFSCRRLDQSGYNCSAAPLKCGLTGSKIYSVGTSGLFVSEDCLRKD